jgi:hypothetical protein
MMAIILKWVAVNVVTLKKSRLYLVKIRTRLDFVRACYTHKI